MKTDDIALGEKLLAAFGHFETSGFGAAGGSFASPAYDARAECFARGRNDAADLTIGVNAESLAIHTDTQRRLPMAFLQTSHFERQISQRTENESPGQLRGRVGIARAAGRNDNPFFRARLKIDMGRRPPGLADELELRQLFNQCARKIGALLG